MPKPSSFFNDQPGMHKIENQVLVNLIGTSKLRHKMLLFLHGVLVPKNLKLFKGARAFTPEIH